MKFAVFGDLHLGIKQDSTAWHEVALEWGERFIAELQSRNIKTAVFLGDFFHNRITVSVNTLYVASQFLDMFHEAGIDLHMIIGNHDQYYLNDPEVSGVQLFSKYPNITVYNKPTEVQFGSKKCWFVGWGYDQLQYSGDILFTHAEINIFRFNAKQGECNGGLKCSDLLDRYNLVYTGHFHLRQSKKYDNGEVRYPGNPFQMDYSDEFTEKGFEIYDTETGDVEFVADKLTPKFFRIKLSDLIKVDVNKIKRAIYNSYFKLIVDMNITLQDLAQLMRLVDDCQPRTSTHEWENGQKFSQSIEDGDFQPFEIEKAIEKYISKMNVPRKQEIYEIIIKLYRRAKEQQA